MKLDQLHCFLEACKYHSISVAAEKNFISQPSFSSAITKLEKELGLTLLNRNSRGVTPTPDGVAILEKSQEIFSLINDINDIATAHSVLGTVRLATIPCLLDSILPISAQLAKEKIWTFNSISIPLKAMKSITPSSPVLNLLASSFSQAT